MNMTLVRRLLGASLVGLLAAAPHVAPAHADVPTDQGIGIRLMEAPTDRQDDPRARTYIVDHVSPGTSFSRRIEVSNGTTQRRTLAIYLAPADISEGVFGIDELGATSELTEWASVTPSSVTLNPGKTAEVGVTIEVPARATAGERYGAVVLEAPAEAVPGQDVAIASRVAVRTYLSVGAGRPRPERSLACGRQNQRPGRQSDEQRRAARRAAA